MIEHYWVLLCGENYAEFLGMSCLMALLFAALPCFVLAMTVVEAYIKSRR